MAAIRRVTTIESDEEAEFFEESDDEVIEDNKNKKNVKGKAAKNVFNEDFKFADDFEANESKWKIQKHIKDSAKGSDSSVSLEQKIMRKRMKNESNITKKSREDVAAEDFTQILGNHGKEEKHEEASSRMDLQARSQKENSDKDDSSEEEEDDDGFFEQPPPLVPYESFSRLNISRPILRALNELGFQQPTPIQCSTIPVALLGKDICACAATGTGKTASFMLPILERLLFRPKQVPVSRVLVLVPTRELAVQVHSVSRSLAKYLDLQICLIAGGLRMKEQESALRKEPDIIIATPGRLVDHLHNTPSFGLQNIEILVLDEADRMLEEHFEEQMKDIIQQCQKGRQTMLFSATMTDKVEELVSLSLNHPVRIFIDQNTNVAACLQQEFVRIRGHREDDRLAIVTALCCRTFNNHCLVFCQTKKLAHQLRIILGLFGLKAGELHGNLNQAQRLEALDLFKDGKLDVLVATDLAARGLDISGVKTVISFNMPTSFKSYIHRVGRTARAGKFGRSITLVGEKERKNLKLACKTSELPVKHRIISPEIIELFKGKLKDLQRDIADILKEEEEDKQIRISEMEMTKAKNMVIHHEEIMSRPPKSWIKKESKSDPKKRATKPERKSEDELKAAKEVEYLKRATKRERKPKRMRACSEKDDVQRVNKGGAKRKRVDGKDKMVEKELTDVSKKSLKEFRSRSAFGKTKSKAGKFKSRKKFKRR